MKSDIIYDADAAPSVWQRVMGSAAKTAPETDEVNYFLRRETELLALYRRAGKMCAGSTRALFSKQAGMKAAACRSLAVHHFIKTGSTFDSALAPPPVFSLSRALRTAYKSEEELSRQYMRSAMLQEDSALAELYVNLSFQSKKSAGAVMKTISSMLGETY